ncbi:unnamed protein product [Durusdinium trenchii]|uniref:Solute carrier family 40 protein n=1 Tax=Durusdinium trenchii TaxID=1381693 RepID=A0ABP0I7H6_9DINO
MKRATEMKAKAMEMKESYPKTVKVADRLVNMGLNYLDIVTDVIVVLSYGCFTNNSLTISCNNQDVFLSNSTNSTTNATITLEEEALCQPHWWWFGIGLSLLVVSTLVQACFYGGFSDSVTWGVVSLCQLSYVRDVWLATQDDDPNDKGDGEATPAMLRDVIVKLTECAPQLYLQSYILFAVGAHGHFVNVFSTLVSASSLSYGIAKRYSFLDLKEKILVFFFLATDQLLRASAYAFILSDAVRPIGITLAVLFLVGLTALVCCAGGSETGCSYLLFGHLVPVSFFQVADPEKSQSEKRAWFLCLIGRYIEMIIYGLLGLTVATTSCGYAPVNEVVAFFALLAVNVVLLLLFVCWICKNGALSSSIMHKRQEMETE